VFVLRERGGHHAPELAKVKLLIEEVGAALLLPLQFQEGAARPYKLDGRRAHELAAVLRVRGAGCEVDGLDNGLDEDGVDLDGQHLPHGEDLAVELLLEVGRQVVAFELHREREEKRGTEGGERGGSF